MDFAAEEKRISSAMGRTSDDRLVARFGEVELQSAFQPILRHGKGSLIVDGYEALLRPSRAGNPIAVHDFLNLVPRSQSFFVERLSRVMHVRGFARQSNGEGRLYLNIEPMAFSDAVRTGVLVDKFPAHLRRHGLDPAKVVFELVETRHDDMVVLAEAAKQLRSIGVSIAIDDFGAQYSNFDRVFDLEPDLVKFDRQLLARCRGNARAVRFLNGMVSLVKELDVEVSCEGIETETELRIAIDAGFDLLQGYYLGMPSPLLDYRTAEIPRRVLVNDQQRIVG